MNLNRKLIAIGVAAVFATGCQTMQAKDKETLGQVAGGVLGAVLGSQVGGGKGRILAGVLGAAAGVWLGGQIARHLSAQEQAAVERESARTLTGARDGETVRWQSDESGAQAAMTARDSRVQERQVTVVRDRRVEWSPDMDLLGESYVARTASNVRQGPTTDATVVNSLTEGEVFTAVGRVRGRDWIMVGKEGRSVGYVYAPLVEPSTDVQTTAGLRKAVNLDELELEDETLVAESVTVQTRCRTLDYTVQAGNGESATDSFNACKSPDGAWEII